MIITIITPTLNSEKYLKECIESVLNQSINTEHILIDGGSTDGTLHILKKYQEENPTKIKIIVGKDSGPGEAWNKGLLTATGDILGWLGADDTYEQGALANISEFFINNPDICFIFGGQNFINDAGEILMTCIPEKYSFNKLLNNKQMINTTSAFYRREIIQSVGYLDSQGDDLDFYLRIAKKFKIYSTNKILSNFRIHNNSQTSGANLIKRKFWLKTWCQTCIKHGGSRLSNYCIKYYIFNIFGWALPIWNSLYFYIMKKFKKRLL